MLVGDCTRDEKRFEKGTKKNVREEIKKDDGTVIQREIFISPIGIFILLTSTFFRSSSFGLPRSFFFLMFHVYDANVSAVNLQNWSTYFPLRTAFSRFREITHEIFTGV